MKKYLTILLICTFGMLYARCIPTTLSITTFGAVADGTTDNYQAFVDAASYAANHQNTTITFPSGVFYIAKYRSMKNDVINHIIWDSCIGLKLIGSTGTVISMNGTFFRKVDYTTSTCAKKSYTTGLSPFWFFHCRNLEIRNMEINGNAQNTTRLPGADINNPSVTEGEAIMLRFTMCDTVLIDNIYVHNAETDGLWINGDRINGIWINSNHFTVSNVKSFNNARQGMSVGGLVNAYFYKCRFDSTGRGNGTYGHNDPAAGVDVEPGPFHSTGEIVFDSCYFQNNRGSAFNASYPITTSSITLLKCVVTSNSEEKVQGLTVLTANTHIDSSYISLGKRDFKITNPSHVGAVLILEHSTIEATGNVIATSSLDLTDDITISHNQFNYVSNVMTSTFLSLQAVNLSFTNNDIYISEAALLTRPTGTHALIRKAKISQGNLFHSETALKPKVDYTGTLIVNDL